MQVAASNGQAVVVLAVWYPYHKIGHEPALDGRDGIRGHGVFWKHGRSVLPKMIAEVEKTGFNEGNPLKASRTDANGTSGEGHVDEVLLFLFQKKRIRHHRERYLDVHTK